MELNANAKRGLRITPLLLHLSNSLRGSTSSPLGADTELKCLKVGLQLFRTQQLERNIPVRGCNRVAGWNRSVAPKTKFQHLQPCHATKKKKLGDIQDMHHSDGYMNLSTYSEEMFLQARYFLRAAMYAFVVSIDSSAVGTKVRNA